MRCKSGIASWGSGNCKTCNRLSTKYNVNPQADGDCGKSNINKLI